jgi:hypothetical protein
MRRVFGIGSEDAVTDWQPGDPLHTRPWPRRPIAELRDDHWCGDDCDGYGPAAARWPTPLDGWQLDQKEQP